MIRRRTKHKTPDKTPVETVEPAPRQDGPWDSAAAPSDDPAYIDFGTLKVRGRAGFTFQLPGSPTGEDAPALVLVTEGAALELRVFAASRSGSLWDEIRPDLIADIQRHEGEFREEEGRYGTELLARIPATLPDGSAAFQPSRIVGIDGPRWMLRATFLGTAALQVSDDDLLSMALRELIVVRGSEARIPREPLLFKLPDGARAVGPESTDVVVPDNGQAEDATRNDR